MEASISWPKTGNSVKSMGSMSCFGSDFGARGLRIDSSSHKQLSNFMRIYWEPLHASRNASRNVTRAQAACCLATHGQRCRARPLHRCLLLFSNMRTRLKTERLFLACSSSPVKIASFCALAQCWRSYKGEFCKHLSLEHERPEGFAPLFFVDFER